jgi:hypothetical protein
MKYFWKQQNAIVIFQRLFFAFESQINRYWKRKFIKNNGKRKLPVPEEF